MCADFRNFTLLSTTRQAGFFSACGRHSVRCPDCSKWRYLQKLYKVFVAFLCACVCVCFEDAIFWAGVDWRNPPPLSYLPPRLSSFLSAHSLSSPQTSRCNSDPSSPLPFLGFKVTKSKRAYANWRWQVSTWTTAERKNQCYLSLTYFNAKTVYWVQKQYFSLFCFFSSPHKILSQHLQYHLRYQSSATTAAAVIQELFISLWLLYTYVCIWARWWLHKF